MGSFFPLSYQCKIPFDYHDLPMILPYDAYNYFKCSNY